MEKPIKNIAYDALVIGAGIAGGEAALNLANTGFKLLLVDKELSVCGKMIMFSLPSTALLVSQLPRCQKYPVIPISRFLQEQK